MTSEPVGRGFGRFAATANERFPRAPAHRAAAYRQSPDSVNAAQ
jgi:hypothetical protein